jgi:hypothetical protein
VTSDKAASRTIGEVRDCLVRQLNSALRRPGMFGGEIALRLYSGALAFADGRDDWRATESALQARGAFISTGVTGAVARLFGANSADVMASVYAEVAHDYGWLDLDRVMSPADYGRMRDMVRPWCARDRSQADVLAEFGPPSVRLGPSSPRFPKTLAYGTARPEDPLIFFHLGSAAADAGEPATDARPALLAVRFDGATFIDGFTFTPAGAAYRDHLHGPDAS